jgi:hypothetical protein
MKDLNLEQKVLHIKNSMVKALFNSGGKEAQSSFESNLMLASSFDDGEYEVFDDGEGTFAEFAATYYLAAMTDVMQYGVVDGGNEIIEQAVKIAVMRKHVPE